MIDNFVTKEFCLARKNQNNTFSLQAIHPKTINQEKIFKAFDEDKNLYIHGSAGTGKSFVSLYLALDSVTEKEFDQIVIIRSSVPSRNQGFLPGSATEKDEVFEIPYDEICAQLYNISGAYKKLKNEARIKFLSTSYLRGLTLDNCIVIADEVQNMNMGEISTVITRMGENSRLIICGDTSQNDLKYLREDTCIYELEKIVNKMPSIVMIEMGIEDICRGGIVKEFLLAKEKI
jgi:phosphate starvation-inducible PhoH-like protein